MSTSRIRVAHVMHGLMMGGLEQVVVRLCVAGRQLGVDPIVVSYGPDGSVRELLERHDIPLVYLGEAVRGMSPQAIQSIARGFREHRVDVAHAHDMGPWLNAVAARALAPRVRPIVTFHQIAMPAGFERGAAIAAALVSDALVACGEEVRTCVRRWAPPGARIELIGNGVPIGPPPTPEGRSEARAQIGLPPRGPLTLDAGGDGRRTTHPCAGAPGDPGDPRRQLDGDPGAAHCPTGVRCCHAEADRRRGASGADGP